MPRLFEDVRFALRAFRKSPGFTAVALVTLALGVGANVSNFTIANSFLLRPMPGIESPGELVRLNESTAEERTPADATYANYRYYREHATSFADMAASTFADVMISGDNSRKRFSGEAVSGNYFKVLGTRLILGRDFLPEEAKSPGSARVVVISHGLWERRFGRESNVLGQSLRLNGREYAIIGVAPRGFRGIELFAGTDVWVPVTMFRDFPVGFPGTNLLEDPVRMVTVVGRLRPGVAREQAEAEVKTLAKQLEVTNPKGNKELGVVLSPHITLLPGYRREISNLLFVISALVAVVLLVATANLTNLLLARATVRRAEFSVRLALGAGRRDVVRLLLTESLLLSIAGSALGLLSAYWLKDGFKLLTGEVPFQAVIDWRVYLFAAAIALATGILMGVAPAWRSANTDLISALKGKSLNLYGGGKLRGALVISQISFTVGLLGVCGLLVRTLNKANHVDFGYDTESVLLTSINLRMSNLSEPQEITVQQKLLAAARQMPGVRSAALANSGPAGGWMWTADVSANGKRFSVGKHQVTPGYFDTLQIPVLKGRDFVRADAKGAADVVIVNQAMARHIWGREDVVGEPLSLVSAVGTKAAHVVGIVKDGVHTDPFAGVRPWIYLPLAQHHESFVELHVSVSGNAGEKKAALHNLIASLQPDLPYSEVITVRESFRDMFITQRVLAWNSAGFGLIALFMATFGIYGVVSYSVAQRTHEYGVRVALGAGPSDIGRLVLRQAAAFACIGVPLGILLAWAGAQVVSGYLFGVGATDPVSFGMALGIILTVTFAAAYIPARRAVRVDPVEALRWE
jgi:predicted permease